MTRKRIAFIFTVCLVATQPAWASPILWNTGSGNTGHWYEAVLSSGPISWEDAQADAVSRGGYLATLLSAEENNFVFGLIDSPAYWVSESTGSAANLGPWIGGYQALCSPEPTCGWTWLNGDGTFGFTNWHSPEPNNGWTGESRLHFFEDGGRSNLWNDLGSNTEPRPTGFTEPIAYIVEYNSLPITSVPEPATVLLVGSGAVALVTRARRRREASPCRD